MDNFVIELDNVSFTYGARPVLENVNLQVLQGDFIAMIGPNGGGKTTLLKLILGLLKPDRGKVRVMGAQPAAVSHHIGYVPQNVFVNQQFPITVRDVVLMGKLSPHQRLSHYSDRDHREALNALARLEMDAFADVKIGSLSGGQRQRVFIARALVTNPGILLLDEPTASIDTKGQTEFYQLLKQLNQDRTIIVVSHDLLVISSYVHSVACVNRRLHFHEQTRIASSPLDVKCPCSVEEICPVGIMAGQVFQEANRPIKD
jgi:zinc transport system ATP-binding protein